MSLKRILEEEAELEKLVFGTEGTPDDSTPSPIPNVDTFEKEAPTEEEDSQVSKDDETDKKTRQSWKQRFTGYKASTDKTISNLRKDNNTLVAQINQLNESINTLKGTISELANRGKDPFGDVITDEDVDTIGIEAVDIVKKATKKATEAAVGPIKEQLEALKAKELENQRKTLEERRKVQYNGFTNELKILVPDYVELDHDPRFGKFMEGIDPNTGEKRIESFRRAEEYLDADRVADFFIEYKESIPRSKKELLEDNISPEGNSSGSTPSSPKKDVFTIREVNKFFDDVTKGVYRNRQKEANEIEARITKAYIAGNIKP